MSTPYSPKRILITGAAGAIGTTLRAGLRGVYPALRLSDIADMAPAGDGEEVVQADMLDDTAFATAVKDVDCMVHLAGIPDEDSWERVLKLTIDGCFRVFEAAHKAGVKRIVYASSNHAIGFYRRDQPLDLDVPLRPDGRYGVSKAFGEALARMYSDKYGLSTACLRIGSFREKPEDVRQLMTWISHRDTVQLFRRCIDHPHYHHVIAYGVSNNTRNIWDNSKVDWLGYRPQDNAEAYAEEIFAQPDDEDDIARALHGGSFASREFSGSLDDID